MRDGLGVRGRREVLHYIKRIKGMRRKQKTTMTSVTTLTNSQKEKRPKTLETLMSHKKKLLLHQNLLPLISSLVL